MPDYSKVPLQQNTVSLSQTPRSNDVLGRSHEGLSVQGNQEFMTQFLTQLADERVDYGVLSLNIVKGYEQLDDFPADWLAPLVLNNAVVRSDGEYPSGLPMFSKWSLERGPRGTQFDRESGIYWVLTDGSAIHFQDIPQHRSTAVRSFVTYSAITERYQEVKPLHEFAMPIPLDVIKDMFANYQPAKAEAVKQRRRTQSKARSIARNSARQQKAEQLAAEVPAGFEDTTLAPEAQS